MLPADAGLGVVRFSFPLSQLKFSVTPDRHLPPPAQNVVCMRANALLKRKRLNAGVWASPWTASYVTGIQLRLEGLTCSRYACTYMWAGCTLLNFKGVIHCFTCENM